MAKTIINKYTTKTPAEKTEIQLLYNKDEQFNKGEVIIMHNEENAQLAVLHYPDTPNANPKMKVEVIPQDYIDRNLNAHLQLKKGINVVTGVKEEKGEIAQLNSEKLNIIDNTAAYKAEDNHNLYSHEFYLGEKVDGDITNRIHKLDVTVRPDLIIDCGEY